jgi:predicted nucleic acid-binding protein
VIAHATTALRGVAAPALVLDASVMVEMLLASPTGARVMARLAEAPVALHAPELLDVEVLHVLRRAEQQGRLSAARAAQSVALLAAFPIRRHAHPTLRHRVWQHRANLSAYDATYVALAEGLGATLLTCDARLARAPGVATAVEVL